MLCHLSGFALNSPMRFCPSGRAAGGCAEGVGRVRVPCATRAGLSSRHRLSLLERVSAEAVTSTLHQVTRERMEDRCRGEYERSFLREFHKVRRPCPPPTDHPGSDLGGKHSADVHVCAQAVGHPRGQEGHAEEARGDLHGGHLLVEVG